MKTYEKIYQILSKNNNFISGETMANQLNISRTAIWKGIKTLEELGLEIESVTNKGYRLVSGDILLPEQLEQEIGIKVSLNNSASTQLDAKMGIESKLKTPHLFLAPNQKKLKDVLIDLSLHQIKAASICLFYYNLMYRLKI